MPSLFISYAEVTSFLLHFLFGKSLRKESTKAPGSSTVTPQSKHTSHDLWCLSSRVHLAFFYDILLKISMVFFDLQRYFDSSFKNELLMSISLFSSISKLQIFRQFKNKLNCKIIYYNLPLFLFQSIITQQTFSTQKKSYSSKHLMISDMISFSTHMKTRPSFITLVGILKFLVNYSIETNCLSFSWLYFYLKILEQFHGGHIRIAIKSDA